MLHSPGSPASSKPTMDSQAHLLDLLLDISSVDNTDLPIMRASRRDGQLPSRRVRPGKRRPHRPGCADSGRLEPFPPEHSHAPATTPEDRPAIPARDLFDQAALLLCQAELLPDPSQRELEILLLAHLVRSTVDDDGEEAVQRLATRLDFEGRDMLNLARSVRALFNLGLVQVNHQPVGSQESIQELLSLLHGNVRLAPKAVVAIFRDREGESSAEVEAASDQPELEEAFLLLKPLRDAMPSGPRARSTKAQNARRAFLLEAFAAHWDRLCQSLISQGRDFPLARVVEECQLEAAEIAILLYVLEDGLHGDACNRSELAALVAVNGPGRISPPQLKEGGRLLKEGLLVVESMPFMGSCYEPGPRCLAALGQTSDSLQTLLEGQDVLQLLAPRAEWSQLVLDPGLQSELDLIVAGAQGLHRKTLAAWGIEASGVASGGRLLLFSGPSGTGKTLAAQALATRLGRSLLTTDCSRILDKYVGNSEKLLRGLFETYAQACRCCAEAPVLLLNEADQLLGRRIEGGQAVDRMHSGLQNLMLEAFETFRGLLIATTNRPECLDEAFARRFTDKLSFHRPAAPQRLDLWKGHLPAGVPRLEELDLSELSDLDLSGGQIALAAAHAIRHAAQRGDGLRREDLWSAARRELAGTRPWMDKASVLGFGR